MGEEPGQVKYSGVPAPNPVSVKDELVVEAFVGAARDLVYAYDNKLSATFWAAVERLREQLPRVVG